jgi:hypothetical protein
VWDVELLPTHGGSLRIYGCHASDSRVQTRCVTDLLAEEKRRGIDTLSIYKTFQAKSDRVKDDLLLFLVEQKRRGIRVAAYGAAAKGNTLLNYAGIKPDLLPYVCDAALSKQGRFLPGSHIPILPPHVLRESRPDILFILPWNIAEEVRRENEFIREWGGKFATVIPALRVS